jgi:hypothetical protein
MDSSSENKEAEESDTDTVARYGSLILIKFCTLYLILLIRIDFYTPTKTYG